MERDSYYHSDGSRPLRAPFANPTVNYHGSPLLSYADFKDIDKTTGLRDILLFHFLDSNDRRRFERFLDSIQGKAVAYSTHFTPGEIKARQEVANALTVSNQGVTTSHPVLLAPDYTTALVFDEPRLTNQGLVVCRKYLDVGARDITRALLSPCEQLFMDHKVTLGSVQCIPPPHLLREFNEWLVEQELVFRMRYVDLKMVANKDIYSLYIKRGCSTWVPQALVNDVNYFETETPNSQVPIMQRVRAAQQYRDHRDQSYMTPPLESSTVMAHEAVDRRGQRVRTPHWRDRRFEKRFVQPQPGVAGDSVKVRGSGEDHFPGHGDQSRGPSDQWQTPSVGRGAVSSRARPQVNSPGIPLTNKFGQLGLDDDGDKDFSALRHKPMSTSTPRVREDPDHIQVINSENVTPTSSRQVRPARRLIEDRAPASSSNRVALGRSQSSRAPRNEQETQQVQQTLMNMSQDRGDQSQGRGGASQRHPGEGSGKRSREAGASQASPPRKAASPPKVPGPKKLYPDLEEDLREQGIRRDHQDTGHVMQSAVADLDEISDEDDDAFMTATLLSSTLRDEPVIVTTDNVQKKDIGTKPKTRRRRNQKENNDDAFWEVDDPRESSRRESRSSSRSSTPLLDEGRDNKKVVSVYNECASLRNGLVSKPPVRDEPMEEESDEPEQTFVEKAEEIAQASMLDPVNEVTEDTHMPPITAMQLISSTGKPIRRVQGESVNEDPYDEVRIPSKRFWKKLMARSEAKKVVQAIDKDISAFMAMRQQVLDQFSDGLENDDQDSKRTVTFSGDGGAELAARCLRNAISQNNSARKILKKKERSLKQGRGDWMKNFISAMQGFAYEEVYQDMEEPPIQSPSNHTYEDVRDEIHGGDDGQLPPDSVAENNRRAEQEMKESGEVDNTFLTAVQGESFSASFAQQQSEDGEDQGAEDDPDESQDGGGPGGADAQ